MNTALNGAAVVLTGLAGCVIVANYVYVLLSHRNTARGIARHYSTVPLVAQILLLLAAKASSMAPRRVLPWSWLLVLALVDPGLWVLVLALVRLLLGRR